MALGVLTARGSAAAALLLLVALAAPRGHGAQAAGLRSDPVGLMLVRAQLSEDTDGSGVGVSALRRLLGEKDHKYRQHESVILHANKVGPVEAQTSA